MSLTLSCNLHMFCPVRSLLPIGNTIYLNPIGNFYRECTATSYPGSFFGKDPGIGWSRDIG